MPKTHPMHVRLRAVALAEAADVPTAARTLGVSEKAIREWIAEAPDQSALERSHDLAMSELKAKMASGETRGIRDLAVVAGIMRDKIARYGRKPEPTGTTSIQVLDALTDWLVDEVADPADLEDEKAGLEAIAEAEADLRRELLRRANAEAGQPHRPSILHWYRASFDLSTGKEPGPHPASVDLLDWCQAHIAELVITHGSLVGAAAYVTEQDLLRQAAEDRSDIARRVRHLVESGMSTFDAIALAQQPVQLDPETEALLERAEAFLKEPTQ